MFSDWSESKTFITLPAGESLSTRIFTVDDAAVTIREISFLKFIMLDSNLLIKIEPFFSRTIVVDSLFLAELFSISGSESVSDGKKF